MSIQANCGFRPDLDILPSPPDWVVFNALPTNYELAMWAEGNPILLTDTNGVELTVPPNLNDQVGYNFFDDGQIDPTSVIVSLTWPVYYESLASPTGADSYDISARVGNVTDFGEAPWSANGTITFTPRTNLINPITGLAWTRNDLFLNSFTFYLAAINGSPDAGATVKFYQGVPRIFYTPTSAIANCTSLPDGTAGQSITIKGDNFNGLSANCRVRLGPLLQDATNIVVVDINTITCDIPDLTAFNGTVCRVFVTFNAVPQFDEQNTWTQNNLLMQDPDGLQLGGADIDITGSGGFEIGEDPLVPTPIILSADASGIYTLVKGKRNDTVYLDFATDDTIDVAIPDPFAKTAYFGG